MANTILNLAEARRTPFVSAWRAILVNHIPFYTGLNADERNRFEHKLKVFVLTKEFEGEQDLEITDTIRVVIAASACRLTLNRPREHYGRLTSIRVFPNNIETEGSVLEGWAQSGTVALSWEATLYGFRHPTDGENVGYHEFAHALDQSSGESDGAPPFLSQPLLRRPWLRFFSDKLVDLRSIDSNAEKLLPVQAHHNEAELFAYATELFFERPARLKERHPKLYEFLKQYYRQDPGATNR